jgi:creatinine amidohydrolase
VDKKFLPKWRESRFPGGCAHACELETSVYLYLDGDNVRRDRIRDEDAAFNEWDSDFQWVDLFAAGPAPVTSWTSTYSKSGVIGAPSLATAEKGRRAVEEAARQLARLAVEFRKRPKPKRKPHQAARPSMEMPWGQESIRARPAGSRRKRR